MSGYARTGSHSPFDRMHTFVMLYWNLNCRYRLHTAISPHCVALVTFSPTSLLLFSRVALYQASVSGLCDGTCWSVCLSIGLSAKYIVAKRLSGSGCRWDGEWGRTRDGCIRWGRLSSQGRGSFGVEFGASHCNYCNGDFATRLFQNYFGQYLLINRLLNYLRAAGVLILTATLTF